jgi:hypothetical protein
MPWHVEPNSNWQPEIVSQKSFSVKNLAVRQFQFRQLTDGRDEVYPFDAIQRL